LTFTATGYPDTQNFKYDWPSPDVEWCGKKISGRKCDKKSKDPT